MTSEETWRNRIKNTNNPIMKNIPMTPPQSQPAQQPIPLPIDYLECARMDIHGNAVARDNTLFVRLDAVIDTLKAERSRSRPHTSTPALLTKFVEYLSRINQELTSVSGKLENLQKIIDADEMTSDLWDDYVNLEGWREALDWAILADSDFTLQQHDTAIRNATLDTMVEYHKEMITRLHTPKNGAVSIVYIRSAVIQHEKSITKIESLKSGDKK